MQIHIYTDKEVFNLFKLCALYGLYGALYGNEVFNYVHCMVHCMACMVHCMALMVHCMALLQVYMGIWTPHYIKENYSCLSLKTRRQGRAATIVITSPFRYRCTSWLPVAVLY